jgi:hypothetical protein
LADYTAIYSVVTLWQTTFRIAIRRHLQATFPATFRLVTSAQIAEEDQTNLDKVVSIFLHRITTNENCRAATRIQDLPNKQPGLFLDLHYLNCRISDSGSDTALIKILSRDGCRLDSTPSTTPEASGRLHGTFVMVDYLGP